MAKMHTRYWAIRTDKRNMALLFSELKRGRLRQGWGYDQSQDLTLIQRQIAKGGSWWKRLSEEQEEALPNLRMLGVGDDSIKIGDKLLLPNLPDFQCFCIAVVTGGYSFETLTFPPDKPAAAQDEDYGHVLQVQLLTPDGIHKYNVEVHADIRSTMRTPMRMWNLDPYADQIEHLIELVSKGTTLTEPSPGTSRLQNALDKTLNAARDVFRASFARELGSHFRAAEWEEPIAKALEQLYPGAKVVQTGGPSERGADVVLHIPNYFEDDRPWLVVVQVKNYSNEIGPEVLQQIRQAHQTYRNDGRILCCVILTTAERGSRSFQIEKEKLEREFEQEGQASPIVLITKERLIDLMTEAYLSARSVS